MERDQRVIRKVRAAMTYPAFVPGLTAVLTLALFYALLPRFVTLFADLDVPLAKL